MQLSVKFKDCLLVESLLFEMVVESSQLVVDHKWACPLIYTRILMGKCNTILSLQVHIHSNYNLSMLQLLRLQKTN